MLSCQAHPGEEQYCCGFYIVVADITCDLAQPGGPTTTGSHSLASLAHSALKTMDDVFAKSSASRYEKNGASL